MKRIKQTILSEYVEKFDELKLVFDSLPDGVVAILDKNMNIATANTVIEEMLGLPLEDIVGKNAYDILNNRSPEIIKVLKETIETRKGIRNYTIESVIQKGFLKSFLVSTAIINDRIGADSGIVLIIHDVSEITTLRKIALQLQQYGEILGKSDKMKNLYGVIESIKNYDTSILIVGETGTGKELVARAIHSKSHRKNKPFVAVNCSALPDNLLESELFGHIKGAFTGAVSNRLGRFQIAHEGTLLLDEVGVLSVSAQVKLLRVIQEKVIEPLGSSESIPIDVRILSATNRDLKLLVEKGEFREDLFYRLKVMEMHLPPLRERIDDILLLSEHFITKLNRFYHKNIVGLSQATKDLLLKYKWPGNVRELENAIEHAYILTNGMMLDSQQLPPEIRFADNYGNPPPPTGYKLNEKEEEIRRVLFATKGNIIESAKILKIHRTTLWRKMKEYGISKGFGKNV